MEAMFFLGIFAPLLVPPFIIAGVIALCANARMERFPKRCVIVAMCFGYLASIISFQLSLEQWCCPAGFWYDKTIWPALLVPVLATLVLVFAIGEVFQIAFSRTTFAAVCLFSHIHLTAYYLWWFFQASPDLFAKVLSFRSVRQLLHM